MTCILQFARFFLDVFVSRLPLVANQYVEAFFRSSSCCYQPLVVDWDFPHSKTPAIVRL